MSTAASSRVPDPVPVPDPSEVPGHRTPARPGRPPAMTDVARAAGVSHQTVSRVLNGSPNVRSRTRARVLAAVQDLGYRRNTAARALATGSSRTLGVLAPSGTLHGPMSTLHGVEQAARAEQYGVTVTTVPAADGAAVTAALERLLELGVDGVVVIAPLVSVSEGLRGAARDVPLVVVEGAPETGLAGARVDQEQGARLATRHLLEQGHRTVWHVRGPADWSEAAARCAGWRGALRDAGAHVPAPLPGDWTPRSGYEAGQHLAREQGVTAVFAANDQTALGLLRALGEQGRRVPDDVSVVGFDDIPECAYFSPPLTTVRQDFAELGRRALCTLLAQITGGCPTSQTVIPAELVVRQSTAPPAASELPAKAAGS